MQVVYTSRQNSFSSPECSLDLEEYVSALLLFLPFKKMHFLIPVRLDILILAATKRAPPLLCVKLCGTRTALKIAPCL